MKKLLTILFGAFMAVAAYGQYPEVEELDDGATFGEQRTKINDDIRLDNQQSDSLVAHLVRLEGIGDSLAVHNLIIWNNSDAIAGQKDDLTDLTADVEANTGDISTNATNISSNSVAITNRLLKTDTTAMLDPYFTNAEANVMQGEVDINSAKVSNATHSGEVTGAGPLTIAENVIEGVNLESTNSPFDGNVPTFDQTTGGFTWANNSAVDDVARSMLQDSLKIFNAESYFTGSNHEDAIQQAINAAAAESYGGVAYVPNTRRWDFDNQTDTIYEKVTLIIDRTATFYVPNTHTIDAIFTNPTGEDCSFFTIDGGRFIGAADGVHDWSVFKGVFDEEAEYCTHSEIKNMDVYNAENVLEISCSNSGGFNSNVIYNIESWGNKSFLKQRGATNFAANVFNTMIVQAGDSTHYAVDSLQGSYNMFFNYFEWDWGTYGVAGRKAFVFDSESNNNVVIGHVDTDYFVDLGSDNRVSGSEGFVTAMADSLRIHGSTAQDANTNRITISGNGTGGYSGDPKYLGIKGYGPSGTSTSRSTTANGSAQLLFGNESGSNYSGHILMQVHPTASDPSSTSYIDALYIDGSDGGAVTLVDDINVEGDIRSTNNEANSVPYMVAIGEVTFASEDHDTIIYLPSGAVIWDMQVRVRTAFNDTGTDLLDIERTDAGGYFLGDEDVSSQGIPTITLSNVPYTSTPRYIVTQYKGQNFGGAGAATAGLANVYVWYTTE